MAKKQVTVNETAAAAAPARAAKPRTPRVKAAQHSTKSVSVEIVSSTITPQIAAEDPHEAIARIAYDLWEARGSEAGSALEDWVQAEKQYREMVAI